MYFKTCGAISCSASRFCPFMNFLPHILQMLPSISCLWVPCGWIASRQYLLPRPPYSMKMKTYEFNWILCWKTWTRLLSDEQEKGGSKTFHNSNLSFWWLILGSEPKNQPFYPTCIATAMHRATKSRVKQEEIYLKAFSNGPCLSDSHLTLS